MVIINIKLLSLLGLELKDINKHFLRLPKKISHTNLGILILYNIKMVFIDRLICKLLGHMRRSNIGLQRNPRNCARCGKYIGKG